MHIQIEYFIVLHLLNLKTVDIYKTDSIYSMKQVHAFFFVYLVIRTQRGADLTWHTGAGILQECVSRVAGAQVGFTSVDAGVMAERCRSLAPVIMLQILQWIRCRIHIPSRQCLLPKLTVWYWGKGEIVRLKSSDRVRYDCIQYLLHVTLFTLFTLLAY